MATRKKRLNKKQTNIRAFAVLSRLHKMKDPLYTKYGSPPIKGGPKDARLTTLKARIARIEKLLGMK